MLSPISIAPMMGCTDRHFRKMFRLISGHALLYTEMMTTGQLLHGNYQRFLSYSPEEHPLALQLGGSDPQQLAQCALMAEDFAYDEVNLNVGCPSSRVQAGRFGACLMKEPPLVADCVFQMQQKVKIPITVKTRIGVDDHDSYEKLHHFISLLKDAGCKTFIMHARKAWLKGLSPKENREIPPLNYDCVYQLKKDFPQLNMVINGGVKTLEAIKNHLEKVDGVMIGREAYANPYLFSEIDRQFFGADQAPIPREKILMEHFPYLLQQIKKGVPLSIMTRHLQGLFRGQPGAKRWRVMLGTSISESYSTT